MHPAPVLILAAVSLALLPIPVAGQDKPAPKKFEFTKPQDIPIPTETKDVRIVDVSLEDALRFADQNNADLSVLKIGPQRAIRDVIIAKAFYDSEIYSDVGYRRQQPPPVNVFANNRKIFDAQAGWRRRVVSGALFDANLSTIRTSQRPTLIGGGVLAAGRTYQTSLNLSVTQPLLRAGWGTYGEADIRRSESARVSQDEAFEQSRQDTLLSVARAFWELVFARADYRVQYQARELAQEQLRITLARIAVRDLAERDRVADDAEVARQQEALIIAENLIRQREDDLRALLFDGNPEVWEWGIRPDSPIEPDLSVVTELQWLDVAKTAMQNRPSLVRLRADIETAHQLLVLADGDLWPQLDLVGTYNSGAQQTQFDDALGDTGALEFPDWTVRLQFSYPLGNRAAQARKERAQLDLEESRRLVYAEEIQVRRDVRMAVRDMKTLAESIRATRESVRLAESDLDTAQHRQRVGTLTQFDVQQRNQELQAARSRLYRNYVDFRIAEATLKHVQGKLRPEPKDPDSKDPAPEKDPAPKDPPKDPPKAP